MRLFIVCLWRCGARYLVWSRPDRAPPAPVSLAPVLFLDLPLLRLLACIRWFRDWHLLALTIPPPPDHYLDSICGSLDSYFSHFLSPTPPSDVFLELGLFRLHALQP